MKRRVAIAFALLCACHGHIHGGSPPAGACDPTRAADSEMRRLTQRQYRRTIESIFDGRVEPSAQFPAPTGEAPTGYSTELGLKDVSEQDVERAVYAAEDVAAAVADALDALLPCAATADPGVPCAEQFLDQYGRRAYRRTLEPDERALLLQTFTDALADDATFSEAIALMTDHMLQTPQFLYVVEYSAPVQRPLNDFELASRLSFLFWDSSPDDELLALAESGELSTREAVLAQAARMLASPNADTAIARFFREWTQTMEISPADKSAEIFPDFDQPLADSMNESFDRFALASVRDGGSLHEILTTSDAFVDARMAAFFGVEPPADWVRTAIDPSRQRGLLTQPALLASLAHSDRTSYVFRGRFVRRRLLCDVFGSPPANAMGTRFSLPPDPTARQESEARSARADCASCHALMDPAGLALEHFDAIGRYRDADSLGRPIDTSGTLVDVSDRDLPFDDHADMIEQLADEPAVAECFARQVFRFSMSRAESERDECAIRQIAQAMRDADGDVGSALVAIVGTDAFRHREAP